MKFWHMVVLGLGCVAATGCRTNQNLVLLERELRLQEDKIYELEDCLEDHQMALESCRRENAALRRHLADGDGDGDLGAGSRFEATPPSRQKKSPSSPGNLAPPSIQLPTEGGAEIPDSLKGTGVPPLPGLDVPERLQAPSDQKELPSPGEAETPAEVPTPEDNATSGAAPESARVERITLSKLLTGGYNADGRHGDEGVSMVLEPRDAQGRLLPAAASISVVVLDPALTGQAARVARWDFSAQEIAAMYQKTALGEGFQLDMLWPAVPPRHPELKMFVRYTTADGRKLETDHAFKVDLLSGAQADWAAVEPKPPPGRVEPAVSPTRIDPPVTPWRSKPPRASSGMVPATVLLPRASRGPAPAEPKTPTNPKSSPPAWSPDRPS